MAVAGSLLVLFGGLLLSMTDAPLGLRRRLAWALPSRRAVASPGRRGSREARRSLVARGAERLHWLLGR